MFLSLLYGGQEVFESAVDAERPGGSRQKKVMSVAQDIVYVVSDGKKWTHRPCMYLTPNDKIKTALKLIQ